MHLTRSACRMSASPILGRYDGMMIALNFFRLRLPLRSPRARLSSAEPPNPPSFHSSFPYIMFSFRQNRSQQAQKLRFRRARRSSTTSPHHPCTRASTCARLHLANAQLFLNITLIIGSWKTRIFGHEGPLNGHKDDHCARRRRVSRWSTTFGIDKITRC